MTVTNRLKECCEKCPDMELYALKSIDSEKNIEIFISCKKCGVCFKFREIENG